jgi:predicted Zn-dependent peptidase
LKDESSPGFTKVNAAIAPQIVITHAKETAQAHLLLGCRTYPHGDRAELVSRVVATILGYGSSSRLFLNVRERQGLAYTIASDASSYVDAGILEIYAGVNLENIDRALDSIMEELVRIRKELVPEDELSKAKEQLCAALEMGAENNLGVAERAGEQLVLHGSIKLIDEAVAEIQSVTAEEVQQVAKKIFEPSRLRLAIIAPDPEEPARHFEELVKGDMK